MKKCESYYDKIIFYDDLNSADQNEVMLHLEKCEHCQKLWQEFKSVNTGIYNKFTASHISEEMLNRYTIFLADPLSPDFDGVSLTKAEITQLKTHTSKCDHCQQKLLQLKQEYQEVSEFFTESDLPDLSLSGNETPLTKPATPNLLMSLKENIGRFFDEIQERIFVPTPRYFPAALGAMAALFAIIWFGPFYRINNPYFTLTQIDNDRVTVSTRGETSERLVISMNAFKKGEYNKSIKILESYITSNVSKASKASVAFLLGVSYLNHSKTEFAGRFRSVDQKMVKKAIKNLQIAKDESTNKATMEECDWYIAKAYLLQGKADEAKLILEELQRTQGRRYFDAKDLLRQIESIANTE